MRFATIDGITVHYEHRAGDTARPTLVFVNGLGTDLRIWDDVVEALHADGYATLRYDTRGHGLTGLSPTAYSMDDVVGDLAKLLDHLSVVRAAVVGLSAGGLVAQGIAVRRPEVVRALVLAGTGHRIGTADSWNARIKTISTRGIEPIADGLLEKWFTPGFYTARAADLAGCRAMLTRQSAAGYAAYCAAIRDADHTALVARITVPTLCVVGDHDGATPPDLVRSMAGLISGARFETIADSGHIVCIEQTQAMLALMRPFLHGLG